MKKHDTLFTSYHNVVDELKALSPSPKLIAVSKRQTAEAVLKLHTAGQMDFAESYVNESLQKFNHPGINAQTDICWHFIGPIQRNKTRDIAKHFDWVQSVDRLVIAKRLAQQRPADQMPLKTLIQVNVDSEEQKSGVSLEGVMPLAEYISTQESLQLRGIMGIPLKTDQETLKLKSFEQLHQCYLQLQRNFDEIDTLSMGMSADWRLAATQGSTMIRLGTSLFGPRNS